MTEQQDIRQALKDCLKWMESLRACGDAGNWEWGAESEYAKGMAALKQQPADEPVAWVNKERNTITWDKLYQDMYPLYICPQPADKSSLFDSGVYVGSHIGKEVEHTSLDHQPWVGLTDEELEPLCDEWRIVFGSWTYDFARAIEAKLKEKNT